MLKIVFNNLAGFAFLFLSLVLVSVLYVFENNAILNLVLSVLSKSIRRIEFYPFEMLFFVGAFLSSLLCFFRKKYLSSLMLFLSAFFWVFYYESFYVFFMSLGADSFAEVDSFSFNEAAFWISTLVDSFRIDVYRKLKLIFLYIFISVVFGFLAWWSSSCFSFNRGRSSSICLGFLLSVCFVSFLSLLIESVFFYYDNSNVISKVKDNFSGSSPQVVVDSKDMDVFVYIGESTTTMNMSVYGYFRDTTPKLYELKENDSNFVLFENVYSTHTHTSQSLLEAFSFSVDKDEYLQIIDRHRVSLIKVLESSGVDYLYLSNQYGGGAWNIASTVIFNESDGFFGDDAEKVDGNYAYRLFDHQFLNKNIDSIDDLMEAKKSIVFFHSYAGHGGYAENIPDSYRTAVDGTLNTMSKSAIVGDSYASVRHIEEYDSAIKYIDFSVSQALDVIKRKKDPGVFLYFSDHGESVYSGRGHDSARLVHEMLRVPFIVYFNDAARKEYPDLYQKYKSLASKGSIASLSQLSSTILDFFGVRIAEENVSNIMLTPVVGEKWLRYPIGVRETHRGIEYININQNNKSVLINDDVVDKTDIATKIHVVSEEYNEISETDICYHRANSLAKALRGLLVSNCLEIDLVVDKDDLLVYHPPAKNTGFSLEDIFDLMDYKGGNLSLWVDGKNLVDDKSCNTLLNFIEKNPIEGNNLLIEFPSGSYMKKDDLSSCMAKMIVNGYYLSYYVPTDIAVSCSESIKNGLSFFKSDSCKRLVQDVNKAIDSGLYTDLSFDFLAYPAINKVERAGSLSWNTWNVVPEMIEGMDLHKFRMVIMNSDDPNNI